MRMQNRRGELNNGEPGCLSPNIPNRKSEIGDLKSRPNLSLLKSRKDPMTQWLDGSMTDSTGNSSSDVVKF